MPCRSDHTTIRQSVLACITGHCQHHCWFVLRAKMPQPLWTAPDLIGMVDVQAALRDKLLQDHSVLAAFLTGLRMYLEDPTKVIQPIACHPRLFNMQAGEQISNKQLLFCWCCDVHQPEQLNSEPYLHRMPQQKPVVTQ